MCVHRGRHVFWGDGDEEVSGIIYKKVTHSQGYDVFMFVLFPRRKKLEQLRRCGFCCVEISPLYNVLNF